MDSSVSLRLPNFGISGQTEQKTPSVTSEFDDVRLVSALAQGSREALAILFRRYAGLVRKVALRVLKDASEADDLVQDVFVLIDRCCGTFDSSKASVQFWIVQMTYRRALSRRQYLDSRHFYTQVELDEQLIPTTDLGRVDDSLARRLAELDLEKMFRSLSEDQQKTLRLHFVEGYTLDEIAKMLGQTKGNIRHHSFRGMERLRKLIFGGELPGAGAV
jgi:RNA polymerase sigma-70 factor (ECF subfamily)